MSTYVHSSECYLGLDATSMLTILSSTSCLISKQKLIVSKIKNCKSFFFNFYLFSLISINHNKYIILYYTILTVYIMKYLKYLCIFN